MKFKILPVLLALIVCQQAIAQNITRLSSFTVRLKTSTTSSILDTVSYDYMYPYGGVPVVEKYDRYKFALEDYQSDRDSYIFGILSFKKLYFLKAENHRTNTNLGTVRFSKEVKTYNSAGLMSRLEQIPDSYCTYNLYSPIKKWITDYKYSGTGKITSKTVTQYLSSGAVYSTMTDTFAYNSSDQLIFLYVPTEFKQPTVYFYSGGLLDSVFSIMYSAKYIYTAGKLQTKITYDQYMAPYERSDCSYNSAGLIIKDSISRYAGGAWHQYELIASDYNTQLDETKQRLHEWDVATSSWKPSTVTLNFSYDLNHNLTEYYYDFSGVPSDQKHVFTYNSNNLVEKYTKQSWDASTSSWVTPAVDTERYYYYTDVTGIKNVPSAQLQSTIYPVPATAMLNIDISNGKENETAFEVYNTSGQLVRRMVVKTTANGKYTIPVADLSAGTYILHSKNGELENVKQFAVIH